MSRRREAGEEAGLARRRSGDAPDSRGGASSRARRLRRRVPPLLLRSPLVALASLLLAAAALAAAAAAAAAAAPGAPLPSPRRDAPAFVVAPSHSRRRRRRGAGATIATTAAAAAFGGGRRRCARAAAAALRSTAEFDGDDERNELYETTAAAEEGDDDGGDEEVDVAIVGAGIGGLCAGAILNVLYGKRVGIYESHYLAGGCAHAFDRAARVDGGGGEGSGGRRREIFTFDSGPTIVLGCSSEPYNPLRQVLNAVGGGDEVEWIRYDGWGMVEFPGWEGEGEETERRWSVDLGPTAFRSGPLLTFGGPTAVREFDSLRSVTRELVEGAVGIPALAMRSGPTAIVPLLRYPIELWNLLRLGPELTTGTFAPYLDGPKFVVRNAWLRDWIDALAFSLSGLPASRTSAAAVAYVLFDMHRDGAALDYPRGGLGSVIDALVRAVERGSNGSAVRLRRHVESVDFDGGGTRAAGLTLRGGRRVRAREGVICNAPVWCVDGLVRDVDARRVLNGGTEPRDPPAEPRRSWDAVRGEDGSTISTICSARPSPPEGDAPPPLLGLLDRCSDAEMTGSFLHLHLALNSTGLDLSSMKAHYTVMDRGLGGSASVVPGDSACGELNMIAVSNPCALDQSLAPEGYIVVHAYGAGNEPYEEWEGNKDRASDEYRRRKEDRAEVLWRAVESIIPDARSRAALSLVGSPVTHERFLRRPRGTYGAATEDYLPDGSTPVPNFVLCGDGIFPGVGVPAVALSGAAAANSMVGWWSQWRKLDELKGRGLI